VLEPTNFYLCKEQYQLLMNMFCKNWKNRDWRDIDPWVQMVLEAWIIRRAHWGRRGNQSAFTKKLKSVIIVLMRLSISSKWKFLNASRINVIWNRIAGWFPYTKSLITCMEGNVSSYQNLAVANNKKRRVKWKDRTSTSLKLWSANLLQYKWFFCCIGPSV